MKKCIKESWPIFNYYESTNAPKSKMAALLSTSIKKQKPSIRNYESSFLKYGTRRGTSNGERF